MRPLQIWVPDTASPDFAAAAQAQARAVASSAAEKIDQTDVDALGEGAWRDDLSPDDPPP